MAGVLTEAILHEVALNHLGRFATTEVRLLRILDRKIDRWVRDEAPDVEVVVEVRRLARRVVGRLSEAGIVDDDAFAASRAASLARGGRSRQSIAAHLAARGVTQDAAAAAMPTDPEADFMAALAFARRRRVGPFRRPDVTTTPDTRYRELAVLARAGFPRSVALRALTCPTEEAEARTNALRQS